MSREMYTQRANKTDLAPPSGAEPSSAPIVRENEGAVSSHLAMPDGFVKGLQDTGVLVLCLVGPCIHEGARAPAHKPLSRPLPPPSLSLSLSFYLPCTLPC